MLRVIQTFKTYTKDSDCKVCRICKVDMLLYTFNITVQLSHTLNLYKLNN